MRLRAKRIAALRGLCDRRAMSTNIENRSESLMAERQTDVSMKSHSPLLVAVVAAVVALGAAARWYQGVAYFSCRKYRFLCCVAVFRMVRVALQVELEQEI